LQLLQKGGIGGQLACPEDLRGEIGPYFTRARGEENKAESGTEKIRRWEVEREKCENVEP
jgi:hypothetical protein